MRDPVQGDEVNVSVEVELKDPPQDDAVSDPLLVCTTVEISEPEMGVEKDSMQFSLVGVGGLESVVMVTAVDWPSLVSKVVFMAEVIAVSESGGLVPSVL